MRFFLNPLPSILFKCIAAFLLFPLCSALLFGASRQNQLEILDWLVDTSAPKEMLAKLEQKVTVRCHFEFGGLPGHVLAPPRPLCATIKKIPPSTPPSAVSHSASPPLLDPGTAWSRSDRPTGSLFLLRANV
jgi:hypothetical protein